MNTIASRRALAAATQKIISSNRLTPEDFAAACNALAQIFTDTYGQPCQIRLVLPKSAADESLNAGKSAENYALGMGAQGTDATPSTITPRSKS